MASIDKVLFNNAQYKLLEGLSLGINPNDDLLYLYLNDVPIGDGVDVSGGGSGTRYTIAWDLKNCTASPQSLSILDGRQLLTTITPNTGYTIADVVVAMSNIDITSSAYNNGVITINSVTGNVSISVTAKDYISNRLLVWEDDFDGNELDQTKWFYRLYGGSFTGLSDEGTSVSNSILDICVRYDTEKDNWINTYICTNGLEEIRYGRLEARMKCDEDIDQAFWTCGQCFTQYNGSNQGRIWPYSGEIDIMEVLHANYAVANLHWQSDISGYDSLHIGNTSNIDVKEWHTYALEWTPTSMSFYCDSTLVGTADISNIQYADGFKPFNAPHYLIIDAVSANTSDTTKEYHTLVDWVRIYAPTGVTQKSDITALALSEQTTSLNKNKTKYLSLTVTPSAPTDETLIWESSDDSVATFTGGNTIVTKANGTATLSVKSKDGVTASTALTVSDSVVNLVQSITITYDADSFNVGESVQLSATVLPTWATNTGVTWSSSDTSIATVSNSGLLEFLSAGTITITASAVDSSGVTETATFVVQVAYVDTIDTTNCVSKMTRNGMHNGSWTNDIQNAGDSVNSSWTYANGLGMSSRYSNVSAYSVANLVDIDGPFTMVSRVLYPADIEHSAKTCMQLIKNDESQTSLVKAVNGDLKARDSNGNVIVNWQSYMTRINNNSTDIVRTVVITKASDKTMKLYIDGDLTATSTGFVNLADMDTTDMIFGTNGQPTNTYLQALILYNRELSASDVEDLQDALDLMWS